MRTEDLILVSVDDHVVEPHNVFDGRLPSKYAELAPRLMHPVLHKTIGELWQQFDQGAHVLTPVATDLNAA